MKKLLFFIVLLLITTNSYALKRYSCSDEDSTKSCSCREFVNRYATFKVNVEKQIVIQKYEYQGKTSVYSLDGCAVADKSNWVCKSFWSNGNPSLFDAMTDGRFSSIIYNIHGQGISFSCAK